MRFLIAWAVPFWIVLELVPTKLPHYLLPVYPALALFAGRAALEARGEALRGVGAAAALRRCGPRRALVLAAALVHRALRIGARHRRGGHRRGGGDPVSTAARMLRAALARRRAGPGRARGAAGAPGACRRRSALEAPRLDPAVAQPRRGRAWWRAIARRRASPVAAVGYAEPSLVFLLGTATASAIARGCGATPHRGARRGGLVEGRDDAAFRSALAARGWEARVIERVAGLDYSNGKRMVLTLYRGVPG